MQRLIQTYRAQPTEKSFAKLQLYILSHPMAVCMCSVDDIRFLKASGFVF